MFLCGILHISPLIDCTRLMGLLVIKHAAAYIRLAEQAVAWFVRLVAVLCGKCIVVGQQLLCLYQYRLDWLASKKAQKNQWFLRICLAEWYHSATPLQALSYSSSAVGKICFSLACPVKAANHRDLTLSEIVVPGASASSASARGNSIYT